MVAVAQLFARDVASLPSPAGADLCQVLRCPALHEPDYIPWARVRWRASAAALGPGGDLAVPLPSDPRTAIDHFILKPCSVSPEQTIDSPDWWELPEELRQRIEAWQQDSGWNYAYHLGASPGTKAGGWPDWIQAQEWPTCPRGHAMDHLLTAASWEHTSCRGRSAWRHDKRSRHRFVSPRLAGAAGGARAIRPDRRDIVPAAVPSWSALPH